MRNIASFLFRGRNKLIKHILLSILTLFITLLILHKLETHRNKELQSYMTTLPDFMDNVLSSLGADTSSSTTGSSLDNEKNHGNIYENTNYRYDEKVSFDNMNSWETVELLKRSYADSLFNRHNVTSNNHRDAYNYRYIIEDAPEKSAVDKKILININQENSVAQEKEEPVKKKYKLNYPDRKDKTYKFDLKRTLAAYYKLVKDYPNIESLPFNWYDFRDIGMHLDPFIGADLTGKLDCDIYNHRKFQTSEELYGKPMSENEISQYCKVANTKDNKNSNENYESVGIELLQYYEHVSVETMNLLANIALYNGNLHPLSMTFLDEKSGDIKQYPLLHSRPFFQTDESDKVRFTEEPESSSPSSPSSSSSSSSNDPVINIRDIAWNHIAYEDTQVNVSSILSDRFETFYNVSEYTSGQNKNVLKAHQENFNNAKHFINATTKSDEKVHQEFKYFLEARDFDAHLYPQFFSFPREHDFRKQGQTLHDLARMWFKLVEGTKKCSCWLAHGSLLAYEYNSEVFPWDDDHDVQMPIEDLILMAEKFNQTLIVSESGSPMYLDFSPFILKGRHFSGEWYNHIDARIVDVTSGYYIDITGVGYSEETNFLKITDHLRFPDESGLRFPFGEDRIEFHRQNGIVNCKNRHFSLIEELLPTKRVLFGGIPVQIPNDPLPPLKSEYAMKRFYYTKSLQFRNNNFVPEIRSWVHDTWSYQKFGQSYFNNMGQMDLDTLHKSLLLPVKGHIDEIDNVEIPALQLYEDEWLMYILKIQHTSLNRLAMLNIEMDPSFSLLEKINLIKEMQQFPLVDRPFKAKIVDDYFNNIYQTLEDQFDMGNAHDFNSDFKSIWIKNNVKMKYDENGNIIYTNPTYIPTFENKFDVIHYIKNEVYKNEIEQYIQTERDFHVHGNYSFIDSFETESYYKGIEVDPELNGIMNHQAKKIYKTRANSSDPSISAKPKPFWNNLVFLE